MLPDLEHQNLGVLFRRKVPDRSAKIHHPNGPFIIAITALRFIEGRFLPEEPQLQDLSGQENHADKALRHAVFRSFHPRAALLSYPHPRCEGDLFPKPFLRQEAKQEGRTRQGRFTSYDPYGSDQDMMLRLLHELRPNERISWFP